MALLGTIASANKKTNTRYITTAEVAVIAGGGGAGGGGGYGAGGGGAGGGVVDATGANKVKYISGQTYNIVIGSGGLTDLPGGNSQFGPFTALGGGPGGPVNNPGKPGGSGGGSGCNNVILPGGAAQQYSSSGGVGLGFAGGSCANSVTNYPSGGGGGAGGVGGNASDPTSTGGFGGLGVSFWEPSTGAAKTYAAGGGGACYNAVIGAKGGYSQAISAGPWCGGCGGNFLGDGNYNPTSPDADQGGGGGAGPLGYGGTSGANGIVLIRAIKNTITCNGTFINLGTYFSDATYDYWKFTTSTLSGSTGSCTMTLL